MGLDHQRDNRPGDDGGRPDDSRGLRGTEPQLVTAPEAVRTGIRRGDPTRIGLERNTAPLPDEPLRPTAQAGIGNSVRIGCTEPCQRVACERYRSQSVSVTRIVVSGFYLGTH